jgi:hypothetical protein
MTGTAELLCVWRNRLQVVTLRADQCTNFAMVNANAADASVVATIHLMIAVSTAATSALTWPTAALTSATSAFVAR